MDNKAAHPNHTHRGNAIAGRVARTQRDIRYINPGTNVEEGRNRYSTQRRHRNRKYPTAQEILLMPPQASNL